MLRAASSLGVLLFTLRCMADDRFTRVDRAHRRAGHWLFAACLAGIFLNAVLAFTRFGPAWPFNAAAVPILAGAALFNWRQAHR